MYQQMNPDFVALFVKERYDEMRRVAGEARVRRQVVKRRRWR